VQQAISEKRCWKWIGPSTTTHL